MKNKNERLTNLVEVLKSRSGAHIKELASYFNVSEMTIRRDISTLSGQGVVNIVNGVAIINSSRTTFTDSYHLRFATLNHLYQKDKIGQFAASLVEKEDVLIIDTGSTTEALAKHLDSTIPLTVLCYNYNILNYIIEKVNIKLIFPGGYYHTNTQLFESPEGVSLIKNIRAAKVFVSAAGVHESMGVTCANNYEINYKRAIMGSGFECILLVDSSKFSVIKPAYFANLENFHTIITDSGITKEWVTIINKKNLKLHIV